MARDEQIAVPLKEKKGRLKSLPPPKGEVYTVKKGEQPKPVPL
jgi:hypothetical protein